MGLQSPWSFNTEDKGAIGRGGGARRGGDTRKVALVGGPTVPPTHTHGRRLQVLLALEANSPMSF